MALAIFHLQSKFHKSRKGFISLKKARRSVLFSGTGVHNGLNQNRAEHRFHEKDNITTQLEIRKGSPYIFTTFPQNLGKRGSGSPHSLGWGSIISAQSFHQAVGSEAERLSDYYVSVLLQVTRPVSDMSTIFGICVKQCFR
ncbi:MAG: hypothetical protein ACI3VU_07055 [Faecousia sp.]